MKNMIILVIFALLALAGCAHESVRSSALHIPDDRRPATKVDMGAVTAAVDGRCEVPSSGRSL